MDKHKLIRPKPKRELMVVIRVFNLPKFTENKKLDLVFGFIDVDCVDGRCPCVNCLIARISLVLIHIGIISIPSIDLVILLRERADGVGLARGVSGNQLGDDVNAKVVALAG